MILLTNDKILLCEVNNMRNPVYEMHENINEKYPVIYHINSFENQFGCCPNWHDNIEILCMIYGKCEVNLDSAVFYVEEGDAVVVNSGCVHTLRAVGGAAAYHCVIVDKDFCKFLGFDTNVQHIVEKVHDQHINRIFCDIESEFNRKEQYYLAAIKYLVGEMIVRLYRNYSMPDDHVYENSSKSVMVKKAAVFIDDNCTHSISIDEIAEAVNVSKYYLCRIFKEVMGITMVQFINFRRCKKACRMLERADISISDVAEACGFDNMSYFSKIYKKYMNILPSEHRKTGKAVE